MASSGSKKLQLGVAALLLAGTAATAGVVFGAPARDLFAPKAVSAQVIPVNAPLATPVAGPVSGLADMVEAVGPSVVQIEVKPEAQMQPMAYGGESRGGAGLPPGIEDQLRRFFGGQLPPGLQVPGGGSDGDDPRGGPRGPGPQQGGSLGSGFIVDAAGIVVTNNHVVGEARTVTVQLSDGREFKGTVLGKDPKTDIAVIRIEGGRSVPGGFKAVAWGDSDHARVGDAVFAVGSPFGLGNTVTSGIVSARGREIGAGPYDDFLQVDAAINSGNSGGPLFDAWGRVIGVNTAIFSPSGGNVGIGFAIPATLARKVAAEIAATGHVERGRIGVALQTITPDIVEAMRLADDKGALIAQVDGSGPAARGGLQPGDIVVSFDGKPVTSPRDLARAVADLKQGSKAPVVVLRDGHRLNLDIGIAGDASAA
jgi:serine protease Do